MNEEKLAEEQGRAIQTHGGSGAVFTPKYVQRQQEFVAVNRHDLEDMKAFDGLELGLLGIGGFFFSGGTWLGIEKYLDTTPASWTPILIVCAFSVAFGAALMIAGLVIRGMKRRKINRIFSESK